MTPIVQTDEGWKSTIVSLKKESGKIPNGEAEEKTLEEEQGSVLKEKGRVASIEDLYHKPDETFLVNVRGVDFTCKEIDGDEFLDLAQKCVAIQGNKEVIDRKKYMKEIFSACVISPEVDWERPLKASVMSQLLDGIEERLGLTELARKKWGLR